MLSVYTAPAEWVTMATCLTSSRCSRAGTVSSQMRMRTSMVTDVEPPKPGLVYAQLDRHKVPSRAYLSTHMTLTPQSLASLSMCKEFHRVLNIGPMKRMAGRLTLSKFVVVEYVTLSFEWSAVPRSHRAWWKCFVHIMRIAWSSGEKDVIAERMQCYQKKRRWAELGREQDITSRFAKRARALAGLC